MNFNPNPLKVEYRKGSKAFFKQIPGFSIVGVKDLRFFNQLTNESRLIKDDVTIWHYETNTYLHRSTSTPALSANTMPFVFVGNNVKPSGNITFRTDYSGTTTQSGMTLTAGAVDSSTIFGFITTATTAMTSTVSAATVGNNFYIAYNNLSAATTTNWYGAISASTAAAGIAISGFGTFVLNADTTFYLSATTADSDSGYDFLQRLV